MDLLPVHIKVPRLLGFASFTLILFALFPATAHAASFYVSPGSKSVGVGQTFTVTVRENSGGDAVNAVQASLSYSSDKLAFVSIGGGGPFTVAAQNSGGGGIVQIGKGVIGAGVSGDQLVGSVTFRATAEGTASVSFIGGSSIVRGSDQANVYSGGSGGTFTIGAGSSSSSTSTTTNTQSATPTTAPKPVPMISNVQVANITRDHATISWTTDIDSTSTVEYGLSQTYGIESDDTTLTKDHSVILTAALVPGTTYHFRAKSNIGGDAEDGVSDDKSFTTSGYTVTLVIQDTNGILANTTITLVTASGTRTGTTDANGKVTFTDVPSGTQTILPEGASQPVGFHVNDTADETPQNFQLQVAGIHRLGTSPVWLSVGIVFLAALFAVIIPIVRRRRRRKMMQQQGQPPVTQP